jgi:mannobiose 2-epimerase
LARVDIVSQSFRNPSDEFSPELSERMNATAYGTAPSPDACRQLLLDHVVAPWFPRSIDRQFGGFLSSFDRQWRTDGANDKLLEFQARQTLTAAELMMCFPSIPAIREAVSAGFAFLRDVMWDGAYGGWHRLVDRSGRPADADTKHLHGIAYAIQACYAVSAATGEREAQELGHRAILWMDEKAHDDRHGGYFELLHRDGTVCRQGETSTTHDHLGTPLGQKDMNVHSDLFEAFAYVCMRSDEPLVRQRLDELLRIILERYAAPDTDPWFFFDRDWTPASPYVRPATAIQTAGRLFEARRLWSDPKPLEDAALRLVAYCFQHGRNPETGLLVLGRRADRKMTRAELEDAPWWIQFEALKALEYCESIRSPRGLERKMKGELWMNIVSNFIDPKHGGIFSGSRQRLRLLDRLLPTKRRGLTLGKGNLWKDASHDGRALLRLMAPCQPAPSAMALPSAMPS